jgi:Protein of unknown function (DUF2380)
VLACAPAQAAPPRSLVLLECELIDEMREFASEEARRENERRLALVAAELAKELERRGLYRLLACSGCDIAGAKALGAERIARCWVQKVSNLILNINMEVRSAATGKTLYVKSVDIRGNTDESWLRGVRRLVDNLEAQQHNRR